MTELLIGCNGRSAQHAPGHPPESTRILLTLFN